MGSLLNPMKYAISIILISLIFLTACSDETEDRTIGTDMIDIPASANGKGDKGLQAQIEFEETEFDTGKITQGERFTFRYKFKNTGKGPLIFSSVEGSCGCTVLRNYPKGQIMPGEGGEIVVEFDSDNKWGVQNVPINVVTNTVPSMTQLLIKTDIVVPDPMKNK